MTRRFLATLVLALSFAALSQRARATTLAKMSVAELSQRAQEIVRARCVSNVSAWDKGEIWTFTTFDIEEDWRGTAASGRITVRLLGGRTAQFTSHVDGVPRFAPGEEAVLFLASIGLGDFTILSWQQGTFRIRRDANTREEIVTQDTAASATFDPVRRQFVASGIRGMAVAALRSQVSDAIARSAGARQ